MRQFARKTHELRVLSHCWRVRLSLTDVFRADIAQDRKDHVLTFDPERARRRTEYATPV